MPFESIENASPHRDRCPVSGVLVECRVAGGKSRFIHLQVGAELSKELMFRSDSVMVDVAFGTGGDAGRIRLSVSPDGDGFLAKRDTKGRYTMRVGSTSADGLFSLDFPTFTRPGLSATPVAGKPPFTIFQASPEMLAADD